MTSGVFHAVSIESITVNRETRQRRQINDIAPLADSINRLGLIHPIVVTRDHILVAGERRLAACNQLGWTTISAQYVDELDPEELELVELEENIKRKDLSWQEINDAMVRVHDIRKHGNPDSSITQIAESMGIDRSNLAAHLRVKEERKINPHLDDVATFRTARDMAAAAQARREAAGSVYTGGPSHDIYQVSFHDWAPTYLGPKFDVIHCDFPYGIDSQNSGVNPSGYDDSTAVLTECFNTLFKYLDNFCAPSAHIIFWFSLSSNQAWLPLKLQEKGFQFDELPLIWHKSDGKGIAPDPQRRPRRVYETAIFGWRGGRSIIRLKDNLVAAPSVSGVHPHEKAELAVQHFLEMVVDSNTSVFDPTCGSGSALRAAKRLGARSVLGLELDPQYAESARHLLAGV